MQFMRLKCIECGQSIEIPVGSSSYGCMHCGHFEHGPDNSTKSPKSMGEIIEKDVDIQPTNPPAKEVQVERIDEAENYFLQATFILHHMQANISVYGSN